MADVDGPKSLARVAAWNVYVDRVQRVMAIQWDHFSAGQHTASITIAPPSEDAVAAIQTVIDRAVADARRDVIHTVLGPIVKTLDRIDNSGKSKHAAVKEFRAELQTLYDTIHALKAADPAAAGRAP